MIKIGDSVRKANGKKTYIVLGRNGKWITTDRSKYDNWEHESSFVLVRNNDDVRENIRNFHEKMSEMVGSDWVKALSLDPSDPKFKEVQDKITEVLKGKHEQHQQETSKEPGEDQGETGGIAQGHEAGAEIAPQA